MFIPLNRYSLPERKEFKYSVPASKKTLQFSIKQTDRVMFKETIYLYTEDNKSINTIIERNADFLNVTEVTAKG